jgi:hypothetical protein
MNQEEVKEKLPLIQCKTFSNFEDGTLFVTTVGSEETPATKKDLEGVSKTIDSFFEGSTGVRVIVGHHGLKVKAFPLPEDGMLFSISIGSDTVLPTDNDIKNTKKIINNIFKDIPKVKAVIIPRK